MGPKKQATKEGTNGGDQVAGEPVIQTALVTEPNPVVPEPQQEEIEPVQVPAAPILTRGRKKKQTEPVETGATARTPAMAGSNTQLASQMSEILRLLKAQARAPPPQAEPLRVPLPRTTPAPRLAAPPPQALATFNTAVAALDARLPRSQGNIDISQFLTRKAQRIVKNGSIDMLSFSDFMYAYIGYIIDSCVMSEELEAKLVFLRQVAEDANNYKWHGVLDWALTIIDRVNADNITWNSTQEIAMDRLVISRSVANAARPMVIPCPEFNSEECAIKETHIEGRFRLVHACGFCLMLGQEHPHTERACHKKKSFVTGGQKSQSSNANPNQYRQRYRNYDSSADRQEGKN